PLPISLVAFLCPACLDSRIRHSLSAVFLPVSIEDFLIFSVEGHSHLIFLIGNSREIEYREDRLFRFVRLAEESKDIFLIFHQLDPLESVIVVVLLIESRM